MSQEAEMNNMDVSIPLDVTDNSNADFVTPKSTGKKIKVPGRKKVVRVSETKLSKNGRKKEAGNADHPGYKQMIDEAILHSDPRKGVSRAGIKTYITNHYQLGTGNSSINSFIRKVLDTLIKNQDVVVVEANTGNKNARRFRLAPEVKEQMKKEERKQEKNKVAIALGNVKTAIAKVKKHTLTAEKHEAGDAKTKTAEPAKKTKTTEPTKKTPSKKSSAEKKVAATKVGVSKPKAKKLTVDKAQKSPLAEKKIAVATKTPKKQASTKKSNKTNKA